MDASIGAMRRDIHRASFQGLWNVVRFNRPTYLLGILVVGAAACLAATMESWSALFATAAAFGAASILGSLGATFWVYDRSNLYALPWLALIPLGERPKVALINAGFDEAGPILRHKLPEGSEIASFDFFDAARTREPSIVRARTLYPPSADSQAIAPDHLPVATATVDLAVAFMAMHELRDHADRVALFCELRRALKPEGRIVVVEHLRNLPNALAYSVGALHFHSLRTWQCAFEQAELTVESELRHTPLVRTFVLGPSHAS